MGAGGDTRYLGSAGTLQRWPGWVGVREGIKFTPEYQTGHVPLWNRGIPGGGRRGKASPGAIGLFQRLFQTCALCFKGKPSLLYIYIFIFIYIIYRECSGSWDGGQGPLGILGAEGKELGGPRGFGGDGGAGGFWLNPWGSGGAGMHFGGVCTSGKASKKSSHPEEVGKKREEEEEGEGKEQGRGKGEQLLTPTPPKKKKKSVRGWQRGTKIPKIPKAWMEAEVPCGG